MIMPLRLYQRQHFKGHQRRHQQPQCHSQRRPSWPKFTHFSLCRPTTSLLLYAFSIAIFVFASARAIDHQPSSSELIQLLLLILDMDDPERAFVPFSPFDDYILLVNNMRGTSTLEMCAIPDETLLELSRFILSPFNPAAFWRISFKFSDQSWREIAISDIRRRVYGVSQSTWVFAYPVQFDRRFENAWSVDQVTSLIDSPYASAAWPANSIIGSTPEALRKRTRTEKWIDVPEELLGLRSVALNFTVCQGAIFLMLWSILSITFVVDPVLKRALKHCAQVVSESKLGLTGWDTVSIYYHYLCLVFSLIPPLDCRWWWL